MPDLMHDVLSKKTSPEQIAYFLDLLNEAIKPLTPKPEDADDLLKALDEHIKTQYTLEKLSLSELRTIQKHLGTWDYAPEDPEAPRFGEEAYKFVSAHSLFFKLIEEEFAKTTTLQLASASENWGVQEKFLKGTLHPKEALIPLDIERFLKYSDIKGYNPEALLSAGEDPTATYERLYNIYKSHTNNPPKTLDAFIQHFYKTQLGRIQLLPKHAPILATSTTQHFDDSGHITPEHLTTLMQSQTFSFTTKAREHPLVTQTIGELKLYSDIPIPLMFPSGEPQTPPLNSADYEQFLMLLHQKLKATNVSKPLDILTLRCENNDALWGLSSYCSTYHQTPFEILSLDFGPYATVDEHDFLPAFEQMLVRLSQSNTETLALDGALFSEKKIEALIEMIERNPKIAINIELPGLYADSEFQRRIDELLSDNLRNKRIADLQTNVNLKREEADVKINRPVQKRGRGTADVQVDIELEEEQEEEKEEEQESDIQVQVSNEASNESDFGAPNPVGTFPLGLEDFKSHVRSKDPPCLPGETAETTTDEKLTSVWCNWVGTLNEIGAYKAPHMSAAACDELLKHYEQFQYGLDISKLPAGFFMTASGAQPTINFDETQARLDTSDALKVQLRLAPAQAALTYQQMQAIEQPFSEEEFYDKEASEIYRRSFTPEKTASKREKLAFFEKLGGNISQIEDLQAAVPHINLDAAIQLYLTHGDAGLNKLALLQQSNPNFNHVHDAVFSNAISYAPCLDSQFEEALNIRGSLLPNERAWFDQLLKQHGEAQNNVNLPDLVNAFKAFKKELKDISLPPGEQFEFYANPQFEGTKSLPVTLSRILHILKNVDEHNRKAQWEEITALDLSSTGAVKLFEDNLGEDKEWAFITPEMQINKAYEQELDINVTGYDPLYEDTLPIAKTSFFRNASFQRKHEQMPLAFYRHFQNDLPLFNSSLHQSLYSLISMVSIKLKKDAEKLSPEESTRALTEFFGSLSFFKHVPRGTEIQQTLLDTLLGLEAPPKFPILNRLVSLILSTCKDPITAASNIKKLKATNEALNKYVGLYGTCIYEGMEHYTEEQYNNTNLFFDHLQTIEVIATQVRSHCNSIDGDEPPPDVDQLYTEIQTIKEKLLDNTLGDEARTQLKRNQEILTNRIETVEIKSKSYSQQIISLISAFNLESADISSIVKTLPTNDLDKKQDILRCLQVLRSLSFEASSPLTHKDLIQLINTVKNDDRPAAEIILGIPSIAEHFKPHFLKNYDSPEVPVELKSKLEKEFTTEQVQAISDLVRGTKNQDVYAPIIQHIIQIYHSIDDPAEKNLLIKKLTESPNICPEVNRLRDSDNDPPIVTLLGLIQSRRKAHHDFVGLMNAERQASKPIERMPERAITYIQDILPHFRTINRPPVIPETSIDPLIQKILLETTPQPDINQFKDLLTQITTIAKENPIIKKPLISFLEQAFKKNPNLEDLQALTDTLQDNFKDIEDKNTVLSLCMHFNDNPNGLVELFKVTQEAPFLLPVATAVLGADKNYSLESLKSLREACKGNKKLHTFIKKAYQRAPFPSVQQVLDWHKNNQLDTQYKAFDLAPAHREPKINGFDADKAREQLKTMASNNPGFKADMIDVDAFQALTLEMQTKSSAELLGRFKPPPINADGNVDYDQLVAIAAELLYRSKGRDEPAYSTEFKLGSSMEINTTQYLSILTSLKTGTHVTSQIGTGEGKSRIMMISAICQQAMGNTVDFVTSDVQLAYRDFVEYKPLFDMVGAESSMILANSDPKTYKKGGINFSDPASLSLFRNKAATLGMQDDVMEETAAKRTLLLDEADKTYFDMVNTRFNFSRTGDKSIIEMPWVYALLMEYMADESKKALYDSGDVLAIRDDFLSYAKTNCTPAENGRLNAVAGNKLDEWITSAVTAQGLVYNENFSILADVKSGQRVSSEAKLKVNLRTSSDSKFSRGVQQCLHARLNRARRDPSLEEDPALRDAVAQCESNFFVSDEKQIIYSTSSKNLLDDYKDGRLQAVTGTAGSIMEREEAKALYGGTGSKMHILEVPRHRGLKRLDNAVRLAKNDKQHIDHLVDAIIAAQAKNQPILLFAENDVETEKLIEKLNNHPKFKALMQKDINHIHGQMSDEAEKAGVEKAGNPGQITISTGMIGRGTDISLKGKANEHGLNVMVTYLPRERDFEQMIGRSGRFGAEGETRLFLNKEALKKQLNKKSLRKDGFYYNPEAYLRREQAIMDRKHQCERLIKNRFSDFKKEFQDKFFKKYLPTVDATDREGKKALWIEFIDKMDKEWNERWPEIQDHLSQEPIEIEEIKAVLSKYEAEVGVFWNDLKTNAKAPEGTLNNTVATFELDETIDTLLKPINETSPSNMEQHRVYDRYDPAHDGRHVEYSDPQILKDASRKGWENLWRKDKHPESETRVPFANIRAWADGRGQAFPDPNPNIGKIAGAVAVGLVGAAVVGALTYTGILPALFVTSVLVTGAAAVGAAIGTFIGSFFDKKTASKTEKPTEEIIKTSDEAVSNTPEQISTTTHQMLQEKGVARKPSPVDDKDLEGNGNLGHNEEEERELINATFKKLPRTKGHSEELEGNNDDVLTSIAGLYQEEEKEEEKEEEHQHDGQGPTFGGRL